MTLTQKTPQSSFGVILEYARGVCPDTGAAKSMLLEKLLGISSPPPQPSPGVSFDQVGA